MTITFGYLWLYYFFQEQTGLVLKKTGLSVLMTSLCIMCTFFAAALIPIPALRVFSLQAAVLILFNIGAMLLVFPAIVSLDLRRRRSERVDLFCCCLPSSGKEPSWPFFSVALNPRQSECRKELRTMTRALPPSRQETITIMVPPAGSEEKWIGVTEANFEATITDNEINSDICGSSDCLKWTLTKLVGRYYAPFLMKPPVKVRSNGVFYSVKNKRLFLKINFGKKSLINYINLLVNIKFS